LRPEDDAVAGDEGVAGGGGVAACVSVVGASDSLVDSEALSSDFFPMKFSMDLKGERKV
jgi:hypothetical protein